MKQWEKYKLFYDSSMTFDTDYNSVQKVGFGITEYRVFLEFKALWVVLFDPIVKGTFVFERLSTNQKHFFHSDEHHFAWKNILARLILHQGSAFLIIS